MTRAWSGQSCSLPDRLGASDRSRRRDRPVQVPEQIVDQIGFGDHGGDAQFEEPAAIVECAENPPRPAARRAAAGTPARGPAPARLPHTGRRPTGMRRRRGSWRAWPGEATPPGSRLRSRHPSARQQFPADPCGRQLSHGDVPTGGRVVRPSHRSSSVAVAGNPHRGHLPAASLLQSDSTRGIQLCQ